MVDEEGQNIYCDKTGKKCLTYNETKTVLRRSNKRYMIHKNAYIPKRAYLCNHCGRYHLTSNKKNKARFIPYVIVFAFMSCKQPAPTTQSVEPVKKTYYTVIVNGRSYPDLTLYYQTQCGDTFKMKDGRKIAFRGDYMFYEQVQ